MQDYPENSAQNLSRLRAFSVIVVGALMIGFVPGSHLLKHLVTSEPRFHHLTALHTVGPLLRNQDLVLATTDRLVMPFTDRIADQFKRGGELQPAAYIIFPQVNFDPIQVSAVIAEFGCALNDRGGEDIVWGVETEYLTFFDRVTGRGAIHKGTLLGPISVEFTASDILYEFHDGLYLRLEVTKFLAPTLGGGIQQMFPISADTSCHIAIPEPVQPAAPA
jgi:hypothetical protein